MPAAWQASKVLPPPVGTRVVQSAHQVFQGFGSFLGRVFKLVEKVLDRHSVDGSQYEARLVGQPSETRWRKSITHFGRASLVDFSANLL